MSSHMRDIKPELPNNIEAEQAVIGAVFINNDAFHVVSRFLKADHFYEPVHRDLWGMIEKQIEAGKVANPVTLKEFLSKEVKIGDMNYFQYAARLATNAVTVVNATDYANAVYDAYERRMLHVYFMNANDECLLPLPDRPAVQIAADLEEKLAALRAESPKQEGPGTAKASIARIMEQDSSGAVLPTICLPLPQITEVLNGDLEVGNYYGLLSSSGEGKTSLLVQIVDHVASKGHPALVISYDQSPEQIFQQMASQRTGIEGPRIRQKQLTDNEKERYYKALLEISRLPIEVKRCTREGTGQLAGYVRQFRKRFPDGHPMIFLDHVRKVTPRDPRAHEGRIASEINGFCKAMAVEINAVWLSLMQRNSAGMKRDNPRPISSDIFGGEQAKEDFDGILYLYRPDKYKEDQLRIAKNEKEKDEIERRFDGWSDQAELGALKVRFGDSTVRRRLRFEKECTRYVSMRNQGEASFEGFL